MLFLSFLVISSVSAVFGVGIKGRCLIIQNKGGGHGTIGYYLAKELMVQNPDLQLAILQDEEYKKTKAPFSSYDELTSAGVEIVTAKLAEENPDMGSLASFKPDFVIDNWSKSVANATFSASIAKSGSAEHLVFVSSAGMYNSPSTEPQLETDSVKVNPVREVEIAIADMGIPYTFHRPQYIYGPKSNKKYLDYFIGRAHRNLPIPVPGTGEQEVALSHIEDIAALIACSVGNKAAVNQVFNCGTDLFTGYADLCNMIHKEMGTTANIALYDAKAVKSDFPFRADTFVTSPAKARALLGWAPKHNLVEDIVQEVKDYLAGSDASAEWSAEKELKKDADVLAAR